MRIEHKLSPAAAQVFRAGVEELNKQRLEYLRALGLAKEAEMASAALQNTLNQQVAVIQQTESLPASIRPYQLSPDCSALIGEAEDRPAAAPAIEAPISPAGEAHVNGAPGAGRG